MTVGHRVQNSLKLCRIATNAKLMIVCKVGHRKLYSVDTHIERLNPAPQVQPAFNVDRRVDRQDFALLLAVKDHALVNRHLLYSCRLQLLNIVLRQAFDVVLVEICRIVDTVLNKRLNELHFNILVKLSQFWVKNNRRLFA